MKRCSVLFSAIGVVSLATNMANAAIVTDTYTRTAAGAWGAVDNGVVRGDTGTVAASYTLDSAGDVNGSTGTYSSSRVVLDYNLAADAAVIAGGGFVVEWRVNPVNGDESAGETGSGRDFAGIAIGDTNLNPPYGGAGAITNTSNDALRYVVMPRNSGSAGLLYRSAGNTYNLEAAGDPTSAAFNEGGRVFDQAVFDDYVNQGTPDPFVNSKFYDVRVEVLGDFSAASAVTVNTTVNGFAFAPQGIEWGDGGQAYVSAIAFRGPHQYDDLRITAIPEPATIALAGFGCLGVLAAARRR